MAGSNGVTRDSLRRGLTHALPTLLLTAAAVLLNASADAAGTKIYRTVDENGNVVFTDVPPKDGEPGAAVDLDQPNSFTPESAPEQARRDGTSLESWLGEEAPAEDEDPGTSSSAGYSGVTIVSPANDASIRDNAGNLTVVAAVEPELRADHRLQLFLDGALRTTSDTPTFQLANVDRGTHAVEVRIVDEAGATLAASQPATFHLHRRSVLLQPARGNTSN